MPSEAVQIAEAVAELVRATEFPLQLDVLRAYRPIIEIDDLLVGGPATLVVMPDGLAANTPVTRGETQRDHRVSLTLHARVSPDDTERMDLLVETSEIIREAVGTGPIAFGPGIGVTTEQDLAFDVQDLTAGHVFVAEITMTVKAI